MFQAPARYLLWLAAALPILAAYAVEHWRSPTGRGLYWFRLATAGAFAVTLGAGLTWLTQKGIQLTFIRSAALTGVWALGFGLLTLAIPYAEKKGMRPAWAMVVVAWTLLDLLVAGYLLNPGVSLSFYSNAIDNLQNVQSLVGDGRLYISERDEYELKFHRFMRFKDFRALEDWDNTRSVEMPNLNLLDRVAMVNNFDPLVPGRYARWMAALNERSPEENQPWLALMNVSAVEQIDLTQPSGVRFDRLEGGQNWRWYACIHPVGDEEEAWTALENNLYPFPSDQTPLVLEGWEGQETGSCQGHSEIQLQVLLDRPNASSVKITTQAGGWLLASRTFYPGWRVTLDDKPASLYKGNYLFQAVYIPAGEHIVRFFYTPVEFYLGCLSSILGVFVLIVVLWKVWGLNHQQHIP